MTTASFVSEPSKLGIELHKRSQNGVTVTLYADLSAIDPVISCAIESELDSFVVNDIPRHQALEVFYHPYSVGKSLLEKGSFQNGN